MKKSELETQVKELSAKVDELSGLLDAQIDGSLTYALTANHSFDILEEDVASLKEHTTILKMVATLHQGILEYLTKPAPLPDTREEYNTPPVYEAMKNNDKL